MTAVRIEEASLSYQDSFLFEKLSLNISENKITCLLGKSGVGKTSLLRLIAGFIKLEDEINFSGKISCSKKIAYMAQTDLLVPWLTAFDNALLGYHLRNNSSSEVIKKAKQLFITVGLQQAENKYPQQLSGGMRQRVALIRTLLEEKELILMDEPFSSLDAITRYELQNFAVDFLKNKTVVMVTHDPMEALRIADEIYVLGGTPARMMTHLTLDSEKPRDINDPTITRNYQMLMGSLATSEH